MKSKDYKTVFEGKPIEAHFVYQMLKEHGILSIIKEDMLSQVFPLFVASGELRPVKLYVENENYLNAINLIKIYTEIQENSDSREKR